MGRSTALVIYAEELRRARAGAELSQQGLSERIKYSAALIAKIELCERRPSRDFTLRCEQVLNTGGLLERILRAAGQEAAVLPWFQHWANLEQEAVILRCYQPLVVPGLLQTEDYARAVLASGALLTPEEVAEQVIARLDRQQVLSREPAPHLFAVIDEGVLHRAVGGPAVMREQLLAIVRVCAEHPRVRVQVVPASAGAYAGLNGPFTIATPQEGDDVAFLDNSRRGMVLDQPEDVGALHRAWEAIRSVALPHEQSIELISEVAERWN
ncbi:helix-turn-helix domain-containing protein [Plantactinospora sp. DSM 117369]